jgi:hypothetical protein
MFSSARAFFKESGRDLSAARLDHARKLERELIWQRAREDAALRSREKKKRRAFSRQVRDRHRANGKK